MRYFIKFFLFAVLLVLFVGLFEKQPPATTFFWFLVGIGTVLVAL
jgi:hypothetical protein